MPQNDVLDLLLGPQAAPGPAGPSSVPQGDVLDLRWIFAVLLRRWWLVLIFALVGASLAFVVTSRRPPVYTSTVTLLIDKGRAVISGDYADMRASEELAATYSRMLTSRPVLEATIAALGLRWTPDSLADRIKVERVSSSQLIRLTVSDTDPARAVGIAQAIPEFFITQLQALQAERYTESLSQNQEQMDRLGVLVEETQASIDALSVKKIQRDTKLARLEVLLELYFPEVQSLRRAYDDLSLEAAQSTKAVSIVEAAQQPEGTAQSPYIATVTLLVGGEFYSPIEGQQMVNTYSRLLTGQLTLATTIAELNLEETRGELASRVRAEPVPDTQLIRLGVQDVEPARAALIADTIAQVFVAQVQAQEGEQYATLLNSMQERIDETSALIQNTEAAIESLEAEKVEEEAELAGLERERDGYRDEYNALQLSEGDLNITVAEVTDNLLVVEEAQLSTSPAEFPWLSYTLLGAAFGATLALGLAMLLEYLTDKIRTPEDVRRVLGLDTLGAIGPMPKSDEKLVVVAEPRSTISESFRILAGNVRFSSQEQSVRSLLVTSPSPFEGKSFILANLAATMAQMGLRVVVVDADLRRPSLHQLFGLEPRHGLADWLRDGSAGRPKLAEVEGVKVLTSGNSLPGNPAELTASRRMEEVLQGLRKADMVFLDSSPVLPVVDAVALAQRVDGVLLVLRAGETRRDEAQRGVESLRRVGANVVGVVLNAAPNPNGTYRYYSHYDMDRRGIWRRWPWRLFGRRGKAPQNGQATAGSPPERDGQGLSQTGLGPKTGES